MTDAERLESALILARKHVGQHRAKGARRAQVNDGFAEICYHAFYDRQPAHSYLSYFGTVVAAMEEKR